MISNIQQPHPGCYNRAPFKDTMMVMDGPIDRPDHHAEPKGIRAFRIKEIPATGSKECHTNEPRCSGCRWLT